MAEPAAQDADARPKVVAGLRLLTRVGSGGEGEVWEARDPDGSRRALKLIRPELLPSAEELARRGAYLRRIDHPALVRVHRTGRLQGSSLHGWGFLEMDFVDGEPLGQAPADPAALERLEPLAEGLDALHRGEWSGGVPLVHRDVKPANLISRPGGEVVLVDCSTLRGTDTTQLTRVGTPVFAAPEVMTGRVGPPADVYSFGATIVALVTGARGQALAQLLAEPERLDLPEAVGRALVADPAGRPRSCRAVLDAGTAIDIDLLPPLPPLPQPGERPQAAGQSQIGPEAAGPAGALAPSAEPWGPAAGGQLADVSRRRPLAPWLLALAACAAMAWAASLGRAETSQLLAYLGIDAPVVLWAPAAALGAVALHVFALRVAGLPWATTLLAPPVGWAWVLGERSAAPGGRRAWTRAALTGALTAAATAGAAAFVGAGAPGPLDDAGVSLPAAAGVALAGSLLALVAGRARGLAGMVLRLLLAPAWLLGAGLLLAAAVGALVALAPLGRGRPGAALAAGTLASAGAFLGLPGRIRYRHGPDPRA